MVMGTFIDARALALVNVDLQKFAKDMAGSTRLRHAWERVRDEVMIPSIEQNFADEGRPNQWPDLEPDTVDRSPGRIGGALTNTGQGRRAATAMARWHVAKNTLTYGSFPATRWFMPVHDYGSAAAFVPQRQFAMIQQPEDVEAISEILMEWVEELVNKNIKLRYP